ncbi:hypothetical protein CsatA_014419 [Cannabis sativa]
MVNFFVCICMWGEKASSVLLFINFHALPLKVSLLQHSSGSLREKDKKKKIVFLGLFFIWVLILFIYF